MYILSLWLPLGVFWVPRGCFGTSLDSFWLPLGDMCLHFGQRDGIGELIWDPNGILNRPSGSHTSKGRDHDPALTRDPETSLRPKRRETALATFFITLKENWDLSNNF